LNVALERRSYSGKVMIERSVLQHLGRGQVSGGEGMRKRHGKEERTNYNDPHPRRVAVN
jgi:hypothetical protein